MSRRKGNQLHTALVCAKRSFINRMWLIAETMAHSLFQTAGDNFWVKQKNACTNTFFAIVQA